MFNTRISSSPMWEGEIHTLTCMLPLLQVRRPLLQQMHIDNKNILRMFKDRTHTREQCTNSYKKCVNCSSSHWTLSAGCPIRKQATTNKETEQTKKQEAKQHQTHSNIIKKTIQETQPAAPQPIQLNRITQIKLTALILEAHIACLARTERYSDILSKSLKLSYNIDAKFPEKETQQQYSTGI